MSEIREIRKQERERKKKVNENCKGNHQAFKVEYFR